MTALRALAAVVIWLAGAVASRRLGVWLAVAPTALLLALLTLTWDRALLQERDGATSLRAIVIGVGVGVLMAGATYWLYPRLEHMFPQLAGDKAALYRQFYSLDGAWRCLALVPVAAAEEIVWRGLVQGALVAHLGTRRGVVATALIYAAVQLPVGAPLLLIAALWCGLVWGVLRAGLGHIAAPVAAHVAWDTVILLIMPVGSG